MLDGMTTGSVHRIATELGTLELWLPEGAQLADDPGVSTGHQLWWSPDPDVATFTVSHGPANGRSAADLLTLEEGAAVEVGRDDEVVATVTLATPRHVTEDAGGHRTSVPERVVRERLRFRFWSDGDSAVRAGYRLTDGAPAELRAALDRAVDEARLR
jgi:hypothetical protein